MKTPWIKSIAVTLVLSVTVTMGMQKPVGAMLVPSEAVPSESKIDREADLTIIQKTLESKLLREKLKGHGLNDAEIQTRLSQMSDQEVHQLASQIQAVRPAGNVVWVLTVVLLVLLIIYLVRRT